MRLLPLALALAFVGCVEPPTAEDLRGLVAPLPRALFLSPLMTLDAQADDETMAVRAAPFFQAWQAGDEYPTWVADPPEGGFLVTAINVTLYLRASGPVVQSGRFPDFMVYAGSGEAWMGYGERRDVDALVPGRTYQVGIDVAVPEGGLWVSPDAPLGIKIVPVMLQQDGSDVEILVGGEDASALRIESRRVEVARGLETTGAADGELTGTIYAGPAAPETTSARVPLAIPSGASHLLAWMNTTGGQGVPDVDLALETSDGRVLAGSGTPGPREALRLVAANLEGPGDYSLVATTAGSPRASFRVEWRLG